jgi:hypothetical protein
VTPAASRVDDEESTRALERTLTREGGLVLPAGSYEIEPRVDYAYRGTDSLAIVSLAGVPQIATQTSRRHRGEASLGLRVGTPWNTQVELRAPYVLTRDERTINGSQQVSESNGIGDLELTLTKEFRAERQGGFGLLGSLNWKSATGDFRLNEASTGSGFPSLQAALTAVKRQDPLVFFGTLSYTSVFKDTHSGVDIDPGNAVGLRAGAILAASPQTSLRTAFEVTGSGETRINGVKTPGTDPMAATLQFGVATLLSRRALLDIQIGIGVTRDAPDYRVTAAVPFRFD